MSSTWSAGSAWRRLLPWTIGTLAFLGLVLAYAPHSPAQTKKAINTGKAAKDGKAPKDGKVAKEKKEEVRPDPVIPKVIDVFASNKGGVEQVKLINDEIAEAWRANKVQPSPRCTDAEFIRRASLDIIGRIPTIAELKRYFDDDTYKRRSLLIDRLLDDPQYGKGELYAQNFANLWTILLMTRTGSGEAYRDQMHDWLTRQFLGSKASEKDREARADWSKTVTELISASGETNKNQAVNFVLTHLGDKVKGSTQENGAWDMVPITSRTTKLFLGIRTQCVQCHDHPFNGEWGQHHFWGINAFYRQVATSGRPMMMKKKQKGPAMVQQFNVHDDANYNASGRIPYERRNAIVLYTDSTFLDGKKIKKGSAHGRREELAHFIVTSPYFAKGFVNRMWGHFFGKSFTKDSVDDFGDHNPSSFPSIVDDDGKIKRMGLLDRLADDWASKYNHDPKVLIRWICNSQAYGLSSAANKYNDKPDDEVFFGRMLLKPMTPEQLFESVLTATESKLARNKEELRAKKREWLNKLIVNFGNDEGEEASYSGTVVQALLLMNGKDINDQIMAKDGTVASALRQPGARADKVLEYLYRTTLSRLPTAHERSYILNTKTRWLPRDRSNQNTPQAWEHYYQDIMWALLNSNEFILNH